MNHILDANTLLYALPLAPSNPSAQACSGFPVSEIYKETSDADAAVVEFPKINTTNWSSYENKQYKFTIQFPDSFFAQEIVYNPEYPVIMKITEKVPENPNLIHELKIYDVSEEFSNFSTVDDLRQKIDTFYNLEAKNQGLTEYRHGTTILTFGNGGFDAIHVYGIPDAVGFENSVVALYILLDEHTVLRATYVDDPFDTYSVQRRKIITSIKPLR